MATINDIVLIYREDQPLVFARIEDINPDYKRNWYHVELLCLQIPPLIVTWILKDAYIEGEEFTMEGKRMRLQLIESLKNRTPELCIEKPEKKKDAGEKSGEIISLAEVKKRKQKKNRDTPQ